MINGFIVTQLQTLDEGLNEANPILRFEAVSGKRLFCRDLSALAEFVSLAAREYEDEMAQWQMAVQKYAVKP